jgi:hypothetical protein
LSAIRYLLALALKRLLAFPPFLFLALTLGFGSLALLLFTLALKRLRAEPALLFFALTLSFRTLALLLFALTSKFFIAPPSFFLSALALGFSSLAFLAFGDGGCFPQGFSFRDNLAKTLKAFVSQRRRPHALSAHSLGFSLSNYLLECLVLAN